MKKKPTTLVVPAELVPDSITRIDGRKPFNHHLWAMDEDWWWLDREHPKKGFSGRWSFYVIALKDGRFSTAMSTYSIENGYDYEGPCVFTSRTQAIRAAAGRMIRVMRGSRQWPCHHDSLKGESLAFAINWVLETVARETQAAAPPRKISIFTPPQPPPPTGMPLFDHPLCRQHTTA